MKILKFGLAMTCFSLIASIKLNEKVKEANLAQLSGKQDEDLNKFTPPNADIESIEIKDIPVPEVKTPDIVEPHLNEVVPQVDEAKTEVDTIHIQTDEFDGPKINSIRGLANDVKQRKYAEQMSRMPTNVNGIMKFPQNDNSRATAFISRQPPFDKNGRMKFN